MFHSFSNSDNLSLCSLQCFWSFQVCSFNSFRQLITLCSLGFLASIIYHNFNYFYYKNGYFAILVVFGYDKFDSFRPFPFGPLGYFTNFIQFGHFSISLLYSCNFNNFTHFLSFYTLAHLLLESFCLFSFFTFLLLILVTSIVYTIPIISVTLLATSVLPFMHSTCFSHLGHY